MKTLSKTDISRLAKRGAYDKETIYSILDEGLFCSIAYVLNGQPMQIPTGYCRIGNNLYIHGSVGSHFLREIANGTPVCLSVSLMDGLVLAKSAFHHSVNYRSVVLFGNFKPVEDEAMKMQVLEQLTEHLIPGRWKDTRKPNKKELVQTLILEISIEEASAKIRTGMPSNDEEDANWPAWSGVLPLKVQALSPEPISENNESVVPNYLLNYERGKSSIIVEDKYPD